MRHLAAFVLLAAVWQPAQAQERGDWCMAVGLDESSSMDPRELELQTRGTAAALRDPRMVRAVAQGAHGRSALAVYTWASDPDQVQILVPWTVVAGGEDLAAAAALLEERAPQSAPDSGSTTSTGLALQVGGALLAACPLWADRQLLNVAGDGVGSVPPMPAPIRDTLVDRGVWINALVVGAEPNVVDHYESRVIGPEGIGFLRTAADHGDFAEAMLDKMITEITAR